MQAAGSASRSRAWWRAVTHATCLLLDGTRQPLRRMMRELRDRRNFADVDARILDYADRAEVEEAFADYPPGIVLHCAALNYVPEPMLRPSHAVRANMLAARVVATAAERAGAKHFLLASADRVAHQFGAGRLRRAGQAPVLDDVKRELLAATLADEPQNIDPLATSLSAGGGRALRTNCPLEPATPSSAHLQPPKLGAR